MGYRLGVDVGGAFTDLLLFDDAAGDFWRNKTPSTPADSSEGILNGLNAVCAAAGVSPGRSEPSCTAPPWRPTRSSKARAPVSAS